MFSARVCVCGSQTQLFQNQGPQSAPSFCTLAHKACALILHKEQTWNLEMEVRCFFAALLMKRRRHSMQCDKRQLRICQLKTRSTWAQIGRCTCRPKYDQRHPLECLFFPKNYSFYYYEETYLRMFLIGTQK